MKGYDFHHFHAYAVRDRVDMSDLSDVPPVFESPTPATILPSIDDLKTMKKELSILASR